MEVKGITAFPLPGVQVISRITANGLRSLDMLLMDLYHPKFTRPPIGSQCDLFGEECLSPTQALGTSGTKDARRAITACPLGTWWLIPACGV